jgi:hypothetical protein
MTTDTGGRLLADWIARMKFFTVSRRTSQPAVDRED